MKPSLDSIQFPVPLIKIDQTNSTNSFLRSCCRERELAEFTTVTANYQTTGRGQRGNFWESEEGRNLLFSFIFYPSFLNVRYQFQLSQIIALAVKETLDTYTEGITIKWPNDIYWQERKIGGMLIENDLMGSNIYQSIAGIGININQQKFHSSAPNPVSLWQITHEDHDCQEVLMQIMKRVKEHYIQLKQGYAERIAPLYNKALFRRKGLYPYMDMKGKFLAEIVGIEPEGFLILREESGKERKYAFKEVQYIL